MPELRTFTAEVGDLAATLRALTTDHADRLLAGGTTDAAKVAARTVRRAGLRDSSLLTRRIVTSGGVEVTAARPAGAHRYYATATVGGRERVNASGAPFAGQVIFGAEFGGRRRTYANGRKLRRRKGLSVSDQAAIYAAGGATIRRTTGHFREFRRGGYWLFTGLSAADRELVAAFLAPLDTLTDEVTRG